MRPGGATTAQRRGIPLVDLANADLAERQGAGAVARHSRTLSRKPQPGRGARARRRHRDHRRYRAAGAQPCREARYVGITGTNGKSTTTALIGHILAAAGRKVQVGGNIGTPGADAGAARPRRHLCAGDELLSARADRRARLRCRGAAQHHAGPSRPPWRHGRATSPPRSASSPTDARDHGAVIGVDDEIVPRASRTPLRARMLGVSPESRLSSRVTGGVFVEDGSLIDDIGRSAEQSDGFQRGAAPAGRHNWQNAAAAYAAARALGLAARRQCRGHRRASPASRIGRS